MEEKQTKQSAQINIHHLCWLLGDNGHKYCSTLSPFMQKTNLSLRGKIYTIGWEYIKTYLALVKWAGQMFAIAVYDAAERLCQVLS